MQLKQQVDEFAAGIFGEIGEHDSQQVIGLMMENGWQFVVSYLAILRLGHIAMPIDATFKKLEVKAVSKQIPSILNITNRQYEKLFEGVENKLIVFEEFKPKDTKRDFKVLRLTPEEQVASLFFTSGTTGQPKATPNTHRNHIWNIQQCSEVWNWNCDDTWLISVQLSHMLGLVMGLSGIIYHGNTMYLQDWFDESETLKMLASGKISMFTHISTIFSLLLNTPGDYDLSPVRLCISGGAALPPSVWQDFKDRFGVEILECYGTTETGRIASNLLKERLPGSPGRPLPEVDLKISQNSEVLVKSEGVFPGYFNNPKATAAGFTKDGYWRTGDIGRLENGRVILKGRVQERIRRFGYTISPRDVEWALHNHPDIKESYVLGITTENTDSDKLVYIIKSELSEDEIKLYCKQNLPFAWRADIIIKVASLPLTRNGKPNVRKLTQMSEKALNG